MQLQIKDRKIYISNKLDTSKTKEIETCFYKSLVRLICLLMLKNISTCKKENHNIDICVKTEKVIQIVKTNYDELINEQNA